MELSPNSEAKGRFFTRLNDRDFLGITIWSGKTNPEAEIIVAQLRRRDGDNWETVGRLAVYRSPSGEFSRLPERRNA